MSKLEIVESGVVGVQLKKESWAKFKLPQTVLKKALLLAKKFFPLDEKRATLEKEAAKIREEEKEARENLEALARKYLGWRGIVSLTDGFEINFVPTKVSLQRENVLKKISPENYYRFVSERLILTFSFPLFSRERLILPEDVINSIKIALSQLGIDFESLEIKLDQKEVNMPALLLHSGLQRFVKEEHWRIYARSLGKRG